LRARGERDLSRGHLLAGTNDADDLGADALDGDVERLEDSGCEALFLTQQAEQDVLGADVVVLESAGLLLSEDDHLPGSLCESLAHVSLYLKYGRVGFPSCSLPERRTFEMPALPEVLSRYSAPRCRRI